MHKVTNHPVHILDDDGNLSPTALIPFCSLGSNMSVMGIKIDQFEVPVCNSFKAKILNDQQCFEVNPNIFKKDLEEDELSLALLIDYNEEREFSNNNPKKVGKSTKVSGQKSFGRAYEDNDLGMPSNINHMP